jgi:hypothetical protein
MDGQIGSLVRVTEMTLKAANSEGFVAIDVRGPQGGQHRVLLLSRQAARAMARELLEAVASRDGEV